MAYDALYNLLSGGLDPRKRKGGGTPISAIPPRGPVSPEILPQDIVAQPRPTLAGPNQQLLQQSLGERIVGEAANFFQDPANSMLLLALGGALGGQGSWNQQLAQAAMPLIQQRAESQYLENLLAGETTDLRQFSVVRPETVALGQEQLRQREAGEVAAQEADTRARVGEAQISQGQQELDMQQSRFEAELGLAQQKFAAELEQFGETMAFRRFEARLDAATRRYVAEQGVEASRVQGQGAAERASMTATAGTEALKTEKQALMIEYLDAAGGVDIMDVLNGSIDPVIFGSRIQDPAARAEFSRRLQEIGVSGRTPTPTTGDRTQGQVQPGTQPGSEDAPITVQSFQDIFNNPDVQPGTWVRDLSTGREGPVVIGPDGQLRFNPVLTRRFER